MKNETTKRGRPPDFYYSFHNGYGYIRLGYKPVYLGQCTIQTYFCKILFGAPAFTKITVTDIQDEIESILNMNISMRAVYHAMYKINKKVEKELGIKNLFISRKYQIYRTKETYPL